MSDDEQNIPRKLARADPRTSNHADGWIGKLITRRVLAAVMVLAANEREGKAARGRASDRSALTLEVGGDVEETLLRAHALHRARGKGGVRRRDPGPEDGLLSARDHIEGLERSDEEGGQPERPRPVDQGGLAAPPARDRRLGDAEDLRKLASGDVKPIGGPKGGLGEHGPAIRRRGNVTWLGHGGLLSHAKMVSKPSAGKSRHAAGPGGGAPTVSSFPRVRRSARI